MGESYFHDIWAKWKFLKWLCPYPRCITGPEASETVIRDWTDHLFVYASPYLPQGHESHFCKWFFFLVQFSTQNGKKLALFKSDVWGPRDWTDDLYTHASPNLPPGHGNHLFLESSFSNIRWEKECAFQKKCTGAQGQIWQPLGLSFVLSYH